MAQISAEGLKKLDVVVAKVAQEKKIPGFVYGASNLDGEIYFNGGGYKVLDDPSSGAVDADTPFWICSQTKLIAHVAALQLIERGVFTQETPVSEFFPQFDNAVVVEDIASLPPTSKPAKTAVLVKHLLNFTSGLFYPIPPIKNASVPPAYLSHDFKDPHAEFFRIIKGDLPGIPLKFEPGTDFVYGFSSDVLGFIVEKVSGKTLEGYFQENIFKPLGMNATSFYLTPEIKENSITLSFRRNGQLEPWADQVKILEQDPAKVALFIGGMGLYSSLRDYLTLLRHLLQIYAGKTTNGILRPSTVKELFVPTLPEAGVRSLEAFTREFPGHPGGNQWSTALAVCMDDWPRRRKKGSAFWSGWAGTYYFMDPATGIAAVFGTQVVPTRDPDVLKALADLEEALYAGLAN